MFRNAVMSACHPRRLRGIAPGLGAACAIALGSIWLRDATGVAALNPVVLALAIGMTVRAVFGASPALQQGIAFAVRPLLRAAIVLLGLGITLGQLVDLGAGALALAVVVVAATLPFTIWLDRRLGVDRPLAQLIGAGTANQVVRGRDEDVTYALAVITLCGTAAMLAYPALAGPLDLNARTYGLWVDASVHEVVQAVGAAAAGGPEAAQSGTVMKLARVVLTGAGGGCAQTVGPPGQRGQDASAMVRSGLSWSCDAGQHRAGAKPLRRGGPAASNLPERRLRTEDGARRQ